MLRSRIYNGRSILCLDLAPPECGDVGKAEEAGRTATCATVNTACVVDLSRLTAIDGAGHPLLSREHARELRFIASCEPARTLAEQTIGGIPGSDPPICEPCGVWVSLAASQD